MRESKRETCVSGLVCGIELEGDGVGGWRWWCWTCVVGVDVDGSVLVRTLACCAVQCSGVVCCAVWCGAVCVLLCAREGEGRGLLQAEDAGEGSAAVEKLGGKLKEKKAEVESSKGEQRELSARCEAAEKQLQSKEAVAEAASVRAARAEAELVQQNTTRSGEAEAEARAVSELWEAKKECNEAKEEAKAVQRQAEQAQEDLARASKLQGLLLRAAVL